MSELSCPIAVGLVIYAFLGYRSARRAIASAKPVREVKIEPSAVTSRRVLVRGLLVLVPLTAVAVLLHFLILLGAIALGTGVAELAACRRYVRWEQQHGERLLRGRRRYWGRQGPRSWGSFGEVKGTQGFYALPLRELS
jgi:Na+/H+ antiporter NhaD/arsenite permease-like protein